MNIEDEIAQTLAAWDAASDDPELWRVDMFRDAAKVLMPLVKRAQAEALREAADLMLDEREGLPFDDDHDRAIPAAWLDELADWIEPEDSDV